MSAPERASEEIRVSTIELFFDLVFVFTITQLTSLLVAEPTARGVAQAVLIFGNLWWMYGGYAWLTNAVLPRGTMIRLLLLAVVRDAQGIDKRDQLAPAQHELVERVLGLLGDVPRMNHHQHLDLVVDLFDVHRHRPRLTIAPTPIQ